MLSNLIKIDFIFTQNLRNGKSFPYVEGYLIKLLLFHFIDVLIEYHFSIKLKLFHLFLVISLIFSLGPPDMSCVNAIVLI